MINNRERAAIEQCIRSCLQWCYDVFTPVVRYASHVLQRFHSFGIHLREAIDVRENRCEFRREPFHFRITQREASELRNVPDLVGGECSHFATEHTRTVHSCEPFLDEIPVSPLLHS